MTEMRNDMQQEDTLHGRFLTFSLGSEDFALEICYVTEIIGIQPITPLPEMPDYVRGIISLRSKIIPVIDMRLKLCKIMTEYDERTCIIIVESENLSVGLIVDQVSEVLDINDKDIEPPPKFKTALKKQCVKGIFKVQDKIKLILDFEKLFIDIGIGQIKSSADCAKGKI
jgi:purine-binding chemotaxis protein CheW